MSALIDREHAIALREATALDAEDRFFAARPKLDDAISRRMFAAGFERGWEVAPQPAAAELVRIVAAVKGLRETVSATCPVTDAFPALRESRDTLLVAIDQLLPK